MPCLELSQRITLTLREDKTDASTVVVNPTHCHPNSTQQQSTFCHQTPKQHASEDFITLNLKRAFPVVSLSG